MNQLAFGLPAALLALGMAASPVRAQTGSLPPGPKVTITAVTQPNANFPQYTQVDVPLLRDGVAQRSNGRIEVKLSSWPEMNLSGPEIIRVVRSGQIDIGAASVNTVAGDVPFLDGIDLPGLLPDLAQARKVSDALIPVANKELERFNTRIVAIIPYSAQVLFCRQPVSGLADLKGRKVRSFSPSLNDFFTAIGAQPVTVNFAEVYGALERGVVDCGTTGTGSGNAARWYEVASHMYTLPLGWSLAGYYVNLSWWSKLDPAVRAFMESTIRDVNEAQWKLGGDATQDAIECNTGNAAACKLHTLVQRNPMTEVKPTQADRDVLRKVLADAVLPGWVKRCGARCGEIYNETVAPITGIRIAP
jgi:TRAP-type C4-dicarboxylate transport system substrate-binding protein